MRTAINISFNLVDVSAKSDAVPEISDKQSFIDPQDLTLEGVYAPKAATLETDYWKLDGSFETFSDSPEDISWGIWSNSMSKSDGSFDISPVLTIIFESNHSVMGIGFEFNPHDNSYCNSLNAKFYNNDTLLSDDNISPDNWQYTYENKVENFNKLVLTFYSMNKAGRYLKLQSIIYGLTKQFENDMITEATLLEEADITSSELSINTLDFRIFSVDDDFNIFNPQGIYNVLQKRQQINAEGEIDGVKKSLGTFFLDEWKSEGNKIMSMNTIDSIGIMDGTYFRGGMYTDKPVRELIEEIMNDAGFGYRLAADFSETTVTGWLPRCTHREALQQVAIAIGAYVNTTRGGTVKIEAQPDENIVHRSIGRNRKFAGATATLKPYVTGVNVTEHSYTLGTTLNEIYNSELPEGKNEIIFSEPSEVNSVTGAELIESGINYCIVNVSEKGKAVIKGYVYKDNTQVISCKMGELPAGEKENELEVTDATLISSSNVKEVASRIFLYNQKRIKQNISFVLADESVGETVEIETSEGVYRKAIIESLSTSLTGGFTTKAVVIGE